MSLLAEPTDLGVLADQLTGPLLLPGDPAFAEEIAGFNLALTHTPRAVVVVADASDVATTLTFAGTHDLPVGVQATGHGAVTVIDGLMISTRALQGVHVDPATRTVRLGSGVRWASVLGPAAEHGLAPLVGSSSDVGAVGYTLGGGLPVLGRAFGFASDYVRSFQVVTADGQVRQVDADHFPDLFWGLRGGKGNLGVVTEMTIGLLQRPRLYGGGLFYPGADAAAVLRAYAGWVGELDESTCTSVALLRLPPDPGLPEPLRGQFLAHLRFTHLGGAEDAEKLLAPMRSVAPIVVDTVGDLDPVDLDRVHQDPDHPLPAYERSALLRRLDDAAIDTMLEHLGEGTSSPVVLFEVRHLGGALGRPGPWPDAVSAREAAFSVLALAVSAPPGPPSGPAAVEDLMGALDRHAIGTTLVNVHGMPGDSTDRARPWTPGVHRRLAELKGIYDPTNLLRFGHSIDPIQA